ncbi:hypothetical protein GCM10009540_18880 [Streptomyces turgidiscabies]
MAGRGVRVGAAHPGARRIGSGGEKNIEVAHSRDLGLDRFLRDAYEHSPTGFHRPQPDTVTRIKGTGAPIELDEDERRGQGHDRSVIWGYLPGEGRLAIGE